MQYAIITDTSSNIPYKTLVENNVSSVAFSYTTDGVNDLECMAIEEFDGKDYYGRIKEGLKVTTSQITPQKFKDVMEPLLKDGQDILYIGMSSGISGAYGSSVIATNELKEKYPERKILTIDTRAASLGEGIAVFQAIENRKNGMSIDDSYNMICKLCDRIYQVFTVDSLMHLKRTGRLSNASAVLGTVLNIKPLLKGNEKGQIVNFAKCRGMKKAIEAMAEKYDTLVKGPENQIVGIAHSDNDEMADYLITLLNKNKAPKEILKVCYEPVTGAHVGPGTVALFFLGDENVRAN